MWLIVRRQHGPALNAALASKRVAQSRGFASTSFGNAPVMSRREMQSSWGARARLAADRSPARRWLGGERSVLWTCAGHRSMRSAVVFLTATCKTECRHLQEVGTSACAVGAHSSAQRSRDRSAIGGPLQAQSRLRKGTTRRARITPRSFFSFCMHRRSAASHVHRTAAGKRRISPTRNRCCTGDPEARRRGNG